MEDLEICKECGGICCKRMGCHYSPKDFKDLSFDGLKKEIEKGNISIDWWEGNPFNNDREINRAMFLRIRNVNSPVLDPSWGGECSLLTETGCSLPYDERPYGGRSLIPVKGSKCTLVYSKLDCVKEWFEHDETLEKLFEHYEDEDCDVFEKLIKEIMEIEKNMRKEN